MSEISNFLKEQNSVKNFVEFNYEGIVIKFGLGDEIWMNATEIAKAKGKLVGHWMSNSSTKEYIDALKNRYRKTDNVNNQQFIKVFQGGEAEFQGTWIHQKLAIRFAQWLDSDFAIWVDEKIEELLKNGSVSLNNCLPDFTKPAVAARAWADQYEGRLLAEAEAKENREDAMAYRELSQAIDCQTVQEFSKTIGVKPNLFYKWLRDNGYLMSEKKFKNQPYQYYTHLFEIVMKKLESKKATVLVTVINQKGVDYFTKKKIKGCFNSILKNKF